MQDCLWPQDCIWPQTRKRPSPALEASDHDSEDLECRPQAPKFPKLSNGAEDEPTLELPHSCSHREYVSCYGSHSNSSSSPRTQTQPISVTSEYENFFAIDLFNLGLTIIDTSLVDEHSPNPHYQGGHEYYTCFGMVRYNSILEMLPS